MKPLLIVDGYNVIGAWGEADRKGWSMDESRDRLRTELENYCGYTGEEIVLVFDGYQGERRIESVDVYGNLTQVFTRHGETADSYIERLVAQTPKYRQVRVATSDGLEQSQVLSTGAVRLTSRELLIELKHTGTTGIESHRRDTLGQGKRPLSGRLSDDLLARLEEMRRG